MKDEEVADAPGAFKAALSRRPTKQPRLKLGGAVGNLPPELLQQVIQAREAHSYHEIARTLCVVGYRVQYHQVRYFFETLPEKDAHV